MDGIFGPAPRRKIVHRAKMVSPEGHISPLCAKQPRPIDLSIASWTIVDRHVTCRRCRSLLARCPAEPDGTR